MDVLSYLQRIGINQLVKPTAESLFLLHAQHMNTVPFENLDIALGIPIDLARPKLYDKIVVQRRGGFCYELNGLFCWLLKSLGYEVLMLSARVHNGTSFGPAFDHLCLCVQGLDQPYLVDVGFGDSFREPLQLREGIQVQRAASYHLCKADDGFTLFQTKAADSPKPQYTFSLNAHQLADFDEMCTFQQTSQESVFTQKSVCSKATPEGRITISNGRLIVSKLASGKKEERFIASEGEYRQALRRYFGIQLPKDKSMNSLLAND